MDINPQEYSQAEEIQELERLLEEKKRQLAERGEGQEPKETFRELFKERYAPGIPEKPPTASGTGPSPILPQSSDDTSKAKAREEQLRIFIEISFEKGIAAAIQLAKANTPWLLDELHDRLIDEYYERLIQAKQISNK